MARSASRCYDDDPNRSHDLVAPHEVRAIIDADGRGFVKDKHAVLHFVRRVEKTIVESRRQVERLHAVIADDQRNAAAGATTTLSPLDAARYLSPAQLQTLFDDAMNAALRGTDQLRSEADDARSAAVALLHRVKLAAQTLSEDQSLDEDVRVRFQRLIDGLGADMTAARDAGVTATPPPAPAPAAPPPAPAAAGPAPAPAPPAAPSGPGGAESSPLTNLGDLFS